MGTIIAGRFDQQEQVRVMRNALLDAGFSIDQLTSFFINPAGQHNLNELGGDKESSTGAHESGGGAAIGTTAGGAVGLAVGLATLPILGPAAIIVGAGVGAYAGSLSGALQGMDEKGPGSGDSQTDPVLPRHSGMLVAVLAATPEEQAKAVSVFRANGALDVEVANGSIIDGQWPDFDPRSPVRLVSQVGQSSAAG